jgi:hypothetical protein
LATTTNDDVTSLLITASLATCPAIPRMEWAQMKELLEPTIENNDEDDDSNDDGDGGGMCCGEFNKVATMAANHRMMMTTTVMMMAMTAAAVAANVWGLKGWSCWECVD